ncbi:PilT/PilU family type 4a pilus ATPase [bacterium]|nr:PilT/PilU family type 4a pilus ATPase [bacterium]
MINLSNLFIKMKELDASDLFITVGSPVKMSAKGKMIAITNEKLKPADTEQIAYSFMDDRQKQLFLKQKELDVAHSIHGLGRFRLNIYRQRGTIGLVIRRIKLEIMTLEELNVPPILKDISMEQRGLVLVTGATGSGKSTTLAAMIDYINTNRDGHIVTIEDPLEFIHMNKKSIVTQREIGMDSLSYPNALKSALRQAPNVLLIGEIRDRETMEAALTLAETGHLVLSTLHSNNANQTIERIINFFPGELHPMTYLQLSLNLKGVICQRLIPKKDDKGRVAILEIMLVSPRIGDMIHKGDTAGLKPVIAAGFHEGMQTFDQNLFKLYKEDVIDYDTAVRAADSGNDLKLRIRTELGEALKDAESGTAVDENILEIENNIDTN